MKNDQIRFAGKVYFLVLLFGLIIINGISGRVFSQSPSTPLLFDMGTDTSAVYKSFTQVTHKSVFTPSSGFGWKSGDGLTGQAQAYNSVINNVLDQTIDQPIIWTNAITEDGIIGDGENTFLMNAPAGNYEIYIVCGTSTLIREQYFDFTISVGKEQKRLQFEGGQQQFRSTRFKTNVSDKPLAIKFTPRSKWIVNTIMAWKTSEDAMVQKDIIAPFEEWTYRMPPSEWAKWKLTPLPPNKYRQEPRLPVVAPPVSDSDKKRGFIVYSRPYSETIYPETTPRSEDINPSTLKIFATPGEFEPLNFIIYPLKDLGEAKVTVSDIGPVKSKDIDIRYVRYSVARPTWSALFEYLVVPDRLEHFSSLNLTKGENAKFWLTAHIPGDAPAGTYTGKITFECSGGKAVLPVSIRILPFNLLEDPNKLYGIYYTYPPIGADAVSKEYFRNKTDLQFADMLAHGTRNVTMNAGGAAADANGNFNFDWDLLDQKFSFWEKYGFKGPVAMSISTGAIYKKHMNEMYGNHLLNVKIPPEAFSREVTAMVKVIEAERQKRGWPEFLYYPFDEPGRDSTSVKYMMTLLKACKDAGVRTYLTASPVTPAFQPLKPYVDVWCTQPFTPERDVVVADMKSRKGLEYWCYPNHVAGENDHTPVTGARMTYGFGFWRSGFVALIPWMYSAMRGDRFNYLDGRTMDFFNNYEDDGKTLPVSMWEGYREGYDDYRYIYTLEQAIADAKKSPDNTIKEKVAVAEKTLQTVWDSIQVQPKYKYDGMWAPAEFDKYRWQIAEQIMNLKTR